MNFGVMVEEANGFDKVSRPRYMEAGYCSSAGQVVSLRSAGSTYTVSIYGI